MIIFIEILSIEVTICFRTQVNGKKKERKWRDKEERRVGRRERANATGGTEAVNLDRTCFKFWIYNFTCMQIQWIISKSLSFLICTMDILLLIYSKMMLKRLNNVIHMEHQATCFSEYIVTAIQLLLTTAIIFIEQPLVDGLLMANSNSISSLPNS